MNMKSGIKQHEVYEVHQIGMEEVMRAIHERFGKGVRVKKKWIVE